MTPENNPMPFDGQRLIYGSFETLVDTGRREHGDGSSRGVTPYLQVRNTAEAIAWYARVFDAKEVRARLVAPDGTCMNAEIEIEGTRMMLSDEMPSIGSTSPTTLGATSVVLDLHVQSADQTFARAVDAGAEPVYPLADQFYGDRAGRVRDPFGHHWIIASRTREVPESEMVAAFRAMFGG
jgi:PhnB protein